MPSQRPEAVYRLSTSGVFERLQQGLFYIELSFSFDGIRNIMPIRHTIGATHSLLSGSSFDAQVLRTQAMLGLIDKTIASFEGKRKIAPCGLTVEQRR